MCKAPQKTDGDNHSSGDAERDLHVFMESSVGFQPNPSVQDVYSTKEGKEDEGYDVFVVTGLGTCLLFGKNTSVGSGSGGELYLMCAWSPVMGLIGLRVVHAVARVHLAAERGHWGVSRAEVQGAVQAVYCMTCVFGARHVNGPGWVVV